jgi:hypothetical protein
MGSERDDRISNWSLATQTSPGQRNPQASHDETGKVRHGEHN